MSLREEPILEVVCFLYHPNFKSKQYSGNFYLNDINNRMFTKRLLIGG
jgi:hypothetical protein